MVMRAVVVGGGIAGLSSAIALHRAGWNVTTLKQAPGSGEVGAGISLMANALRGLDALGVGQSIGADAVVLGAVCAGPVDLPAALRSYDAQRRPRSQQIARASRQSGRIGQQLSNPLAVALRNGLMRIAPDRVALRAMARYADWHPPQ